MIIRHQQSSIIEQLQFASCLFFEIKNWPALKTQKCSAFCRDKEQLLSLGGISELWAASRKWNASETVFKLRAEKYEFRFDRRIRSRWSTTSWSIAHDWINKFVSTLRLKVLDNQLAHEPAFCVLRKSSEERFGEKVTSQINLANRNAGYSTKLFCKNCL